MSVRGREEQDCCGKQLIDGNGVMLKVEGPGNFMRATKMSDCGASVAIHASVAILGPQSSGTEEHSIESYISGKIQGDGRLQGTVMKRLFKPCKKTLLFVLRDHSKEVRDSYDTMLMHLCSNTLERFKTSLEQSQNVDAIHLCSQSCIVEFDKGCEGWSQENSKVCCCCSLAAAIPAAVAAAVAAAAAAAIAAAVAAAAAAGAVVAGPAAVLNAGVATFMRVMGL
uniref:Uncharacterized protein n=1 Tax=Populus alba TaxID=43335 RepID=A0A4U5PQ32_POPAL|nr:hypothetical protein D5086_0000193630 [Populus alba]